MSESNALAVVGFNSLEEGFNALAVTWDRWRGSNRDATERGVDNGRVVCLLKERCDREGVPFKPQLVARGFNPSTAYQHLNAYYAVQVMKTHPPGEMAKPPSEWTLGDLEQFFKQHERGQLRKNAGRPAEPMAADDKPAVESGDKTKGGRVRGKSFPTLQFIAQTATAWEKSGAGVCRVVRVKKGEAVTITLDTEAVVVLPE